MNNKQTTIGAIVLAAGKGTRMGILGQNKVTLPILGKPMILYTVELLKSIDVHPIIVVVGHEKQSVIDALHNEDIIFAQQKEQRGTADALASGISRLPSDVLTIVVVNGDDSALYEKKLLKELIEKHINTSADVTFLTITNQQPFGTGRIVRDKSGNVSKIVEEKHATSKEKLVSETNAGCYVFSVDFLRDALLTIKKNPVSGEYYLVDLINNAIDENKNVQTLHGGELVWRGVNTKEELDRAEQLLSRI